MRQYNKTTAYYNNRKQKNPPKTLLSEKEVKFLNDILRLKNDNSDWTGHYRIDWHNYPDEHGDYGHVKRNFASQELSELDPMWNYTRQRMMKSRILLRWNKILSDAELLKSVSERLERL